jgi:hypothetical protein
MTMAPSAKRARERQTTISEHSQTPSQQMGERDGRDPLPDNLT